MQAIIRVIRSDNDIFRHRILRCLSLADVVSAKNRVCATSSSTASWQHKGLENTTVAQVLKTAKGEENHGSLFFCHTTDTVFDAAKLMTQKNIGSLVVLKPGEQNLIAGIITEQDYLRKVIAQRRDLDQTRVGEIMTEEDKLITVNSDTNILKAMQLMTESHIRHVPVIDEKIVGLISVVDVVKAVVEQQNEEVKRLNDFIRGYYF